MNINALAAKATRAAARLRADLKIGPADAVCPFDIAERLRIAVRFVAIPKLEGVYVPEPNTRIVICAERPAGRRRYTCGHEIGHHEFGHGTRFDEQISEHRESWSPEELLADRFASALLMPKLAVESAFSRRGWSISAPSPESVFIVAQDLGVGYATLVGYLERVMRAVDSARATALRKQTLTRLRDRLAGFHAERDVVVADQHWGVRPIDVEIGDVVLVPPSAVVEGDCVIRQVSATSYLTATAAGTGTLQLASTRAPMLIRVSRRGFVGLARYRHLGEPSDAG